MSVVLKCSRVGVWIFCQYNLESLQLFANNTSIILNSSKLESIFQLLTRNIQNSVKYNSNKFDALGLAPSTLEDVIVLNVYYENHELHSLKEPNQYEVYCTLAMNTEGREG